MMKKNKLSIIAILASVFLIIGAIFIYFIINPQSLNKDNQNDESDNQNETVSSQAQTEDLTDENLANEIEKNDEDSSKEQRSIEELDSNIVQEIKKSMTNYISGRYAPINEEEYDNAMGMHSSKIIDENDFNYQNAHENSYALNEDKSVEDVIIEVDSMDQEEVRGHYKFNLVVKLSAGEEKIEHEGEFTLSTYDNGYLYLSKFGDISE